LNVEPVPVARSPILQRTDADGVSTWAIVPDSHEASKASPWIIYNHGFGETISSITANQPQSRHPDIWLSLLREPDMELGPLRRDRHNSGRQVVGDGLVLVN
jgi:hypothetical protein